MTHTRLTAAAPADITPVQWLGSAERMLRLLVVAVLAAAAGCTRFQVLDAVVTTSGYDRTRNVAYGGLPRQKLDVYHPRHPAASPARVVVFFYGGDWRGGRRQDYRFVGQALASRGFVAVVPDYRVYPEVTFPTFLEDGAAAVRWVRDNASSIGGDSGHIYLMGHSAGAHIAALLAMDHHYLRDAGVDPSTVRACAALSGPYDFDPGGDAVVFGLKPGQRYPEMEPITFADATAPPMLLLHGSADTIVLPGNADRLRERLWASGATVQQITYDGLGHAAVAAALASPLRWLAPVLDDTVHFFNEH